MYNFKNSILLVVFNYSNCVCNKNIIKNIYEHHFKKIIFYSDYPIIEDDEVNFIKPFSVKFGTLERHNCTHKSVIILDPLFNVISGGLLSFINSKDLLYLKGLSLCFM